MATDYDAPRKTDDELNEDSIEELKARRVEKTSGTVDEDETDAAEGFELPGADLSNEELSVRVLPRGGGDPPPEGGPPLFPPPLGFSLPARGPPQRGGEPLRPPGGHQPVR